MVTLIEQTPEWVDLTVDGHSFHLVLFADSGEMDLYEGTKAEHDLVSSDIPDTVYEQVQAWVDANLSSDNN